MVDPYIKALEKYINSPEITDFKELQKVEKAFNFEKEKVFKDPRLIMFYAWLKGKYTKQKHIQC